MSIAAHQASILLVEDAQDLAQVIKRELEADGYRVTHAADGPAALRCHADNAADLIILDWMLPGIDGLEVLRRIRQASAVPVLMLTARSEEVDRVIGLEVGADDYLTKPFGMRELLARVHAMLRRAQRIQDMLVADAARNVACGETLEYGGLKLDCQSRQVALEGQPIELSKTEFDLLCLLLQNQGRAFSRAYLLDTVWGAEYVGGDRSVDNAMLRLRKKLGPLGENIETVWGVGYRLRRESPA
jgi:DNA-binding response OmpR family regulator